jgi:hypothetical protein
MRGWHWSVFAALVVCGCGDSSGSSAPGNVSNFTGAVWNGSSMVMVTCGTGAAAATQTETDTAVLQFTDDGSGIEYMSAEGCTFRFTVSGDTATLNDGPVTCTMSGSGVVATFTSYTVTSPDGKTLTGEAQGTAESQGTSCMASLTFSATR